MLPADTRQNEDIKNAMKRCIFVLLSTQSPTLDNVSRLIKMGLSTKNLKSFNKAFEEKKESALHELLPKWCFDELEKFSLAHPEPSDNEQNQLGKILSEKAFSEILRLQKILTALKKNKSDFDESQEPKLIAEMNALFQKEIEKEFTINSAPKKTLREEEKIAANEQETQKAIDHIAIEYLIKNPSGSGFPVLPEYYTTQYNYDIRMENTIRREQKKIPEIKEKIRKFLSVSLSTQALENVKNQIPEKYYPLITVVFEEIKTNKIEKTKANIAKREAVFHNIKKLTQERLELKPEQAMYNLDQARFKSITDPKDRVEIYLHELITKANKAIHAGDFSRAQIYLDIHRDQKRGIYSEFIEIDAKGEKLTMPVYLSDARNQGNTPRQDTFENWAVMGLSYFKHAHERATIALENLDSKAPNYEQKKNNLEQFQAELKINAKTFLANIQEKTKNTSPKNASKIAATYMGQVVRHVLAPSLANALTNSSGSTVSTETALKSLEQLKDFGNMDSEPYASVTLTHYDKTEKTKATDVVRADVPIYELTDKQRQEYKNIASGKNPPKWFLVQKPEEQAMVKHYAKLYLQYEDQGRIIPTQLGKYLSGIRNAKETRGFRTGEDGKLRVFFMDYTSGNLGHTIKGADNQSLTEETIQQIRENTGADDIYANALVTTNWARAKFQGSKEPKLDKQVNKAAETTGITYGRSPLNGFRRFESNDMTAANAIHATLAELFDPETGIVTYTTTHIKNPEDLAHFLKLSDQLAQVKKEYEALHGGSTLINDDDNKNLQQMSKVKQMISLTRLLLQEIKNHNVNLKEQGVDNPTGLALEKKLNKALFTFCKSGKDREGELREEAFEESLERDMTGETPQISKINARGEGSSLSVAIMHTELRANHTGNSAGRQGGSAGTDSFKDKEGITPSFFMSEKDNIVTDTAKYNSKLPAEKKRSWFKLENWLNWRNWLNTFSRGYFDSKSTHAIKKEFKVALATPVSPEDTSERESFYADGSSRRSSVASVILDVIGEAPGATGGVGSTGDAYLALANPAIKAEDVKINVVMKDSDNDIPSPPVIQTAVETKAPQEKHDPVVIAEVIQSHHLTN
jgi:hypothetical protein